MDLDAILEKLSEPKVGVSGAEGFSSDDFAKAKGISISRASALIGKLIDSDVLEFAGNQHRPNRVGGTKVVYVYRVKGEKK